MKHLLFFLFFFCAGCISRVSAQPMIYFETNSSRIAPSEHKKLQELADKLCKQAADWTVEGRASSTGSESHNLALSQQRADAVKKALSELGIPEARMRTRATGEALAQANSDHPADRVVLLVILPQPDAPRTDTASVPKSGKTPATVSVHVVVKDAVTQTAIGGEAIPGGLSEKQSFPASGMDLPVPAGGSLSVHFEARGYHDTDYVFTADEPFYTVELLPVNVLGKLVFQNILFLPNSPEIVPESKRALEMLLGDLQKYPEARIQIRGHVNWPWPYISTPETAKELQELSEKRAAAVMRWLSKNGIPEARMSALGLGNTQMLFPRAATEGEQAQNRRVEILLMKP